MDPKNDERIFICLGGVEAAGPGVNRVFTTSDPFNVPSPTWTDMSNGLPEVPITKLVYQIGSDDIIYAGTDVGVYRWDKPLGCWVEFNDGKDGHEMPHTVITDMDIDYQCQKLIVTTWGRGVWETDLYEPGGTAIVIPNNTTVNWNSSQYPKGDIILGINSTLNITGTYNAADDSYSTVVYMPKLAAIYADYGSKIVIDGAHITSECGTWNGIYLRGDGVSPQYYDAGDDDYPGQGFCKVISGRIENAESAINNGWSGGPGTQSGGVMQVRNCEFINNRRSAQFVEYYNRQNWAWPWVLLDSSYFEDCTFDINDDTPNWTDEYQITMWRTAGVRVKGCKFNQQYQSVTGGKGAIGTFDASYYLGPSNANSSEITGFPIGVRSAGFGLTEEHIWAPIMIENTTFDQNQDGLELKNTWQAIVRNNTFNIGALPANVNIPSGPPVGYPSAGSIISYSHQFDYCGNQHTKSYSSPFPNADEYTWGSVFNSTGPFSQPIVKNTYEGLHRGNQSGGTCAGPGINDDGLHYLCNTNTSNLEYDFISWATLQERQSHFRYLSSIPTHSGAGNTFTNNSSVKHWWQTGGNNLPIKYYYDPIAPGHTPQSSQVLNVNRIKSLSACQLLNCNIQRDVLYDINYSVSAAQQNQWKGEYTSRLQSRDALQTILDLTIDDGSTPTTITDIENSTVADQMALRSEMLATSPYVSQEVLRELAVSNLLSTPILLEIILANPEASNDRSFLEFLQYEIPNPFTASMVSLIETSWETPTSRESLEMNIAGFNRELAALHKKIVQAYQYSPAVRNQDSLLAWMDKVPSLPNEYLKIDRAFNAGNYALAESILNNLSVNWEMNEEQFNAYTDYQSLYTVRKEIANSGNALNKLSDIQKLNVKQIADRPNPTFAREMARDLLCFFYNDCYPTNLDINIASHKTAPRVKNLAEEKASALQVYPNPAKDHVTFQVMNPDKACTDCKLLITDLHGRTVYEATLNELSGMHIWDTREVAAGAYIYQVKTNQAVESGKIVITK